MENKLTVLVDSAQKLTIIPDEHGLHITLEEMGHDWSKTISCRLSKEQTESLAEQMDRLEQFLGKSTQRSQPRGELRSDCRVRSRWGTSNKFVGRVRGVWPASKTIDLEGRIVKDGVRKALRGRQLALTELVHAIRQFRKIADSKPLTLQGSEYPQAVEELNKAIDRAGRLLIF